MPGEHHHRPHVGFFDNRFIVFVSRRPLHTDSKDTCKWYSMQKLFATVGPRITLTELLTAMELAETRRMLWYSLVIHTGFGRVYLYIPLLQRHSTPSRAPRSTRARQIQVRTTPGVPSSPADPSVSRAKRRRPFDEPGKRLF
jgi:hypothetical protein